MTDKSGGGGSDYKVGKNKPPVEHRFKPGDRGNPKGRPKGSPNFATVIKKTAREKVSITQGGKTTMMTKFEAVSKQLFNQAINGNTRAIQICFEMLKQIERTDATQAPEVDPAVRRKADAEILKSLKVRLNKFGAKSGGDDDKT